MGHLPPAATYQLVELDMTTSDPACSSEALQSFTKQLAAREKVRATRIAREKKYNDRVERVNTQKFVEFKQQALGESGVVRRPSQPIIRYLAEEEEKKEATVTVPKHEPVGFIGLDDDDDHGFERAFGGFKRKGQGGDSSNDPGGGGDAAAFSLTQALTKKAARV